MDEDERRIRDHLMVVDALVRAIDRRDEVFQVIEDSEEENEAIRRVGQLLGVDDFGSRVVLGLQFRRLTRDQRQASLPRPRDSDQSCRMAAEDFVFSVDYWFCQREATKKRLVTVVPAPFHDSGFAASVPIPCP